MGNSYASQRKLERRQSVRQLLRNDEQFSGSKYLEYCASGNLGGIQRQLKFPNARPHFIDKNGNSAAHHCARTGEVKALKLLFSRYITHTHSAGRNKPMLKKVLNSENHRGETPLELAVKDGYTDVVKLLVTNGADVKATCHISDELRAVSSKENTYLHLAVSESNEDMVHELVKRHIALDAGNDSGETALFDAALRFDQKMVDLLLMYGANLHKPNRKGITPAHILLFEADDPRAERLSDAEKTRRSVKTGDDADAPTLHLVGNGVFGFFDGATGACVLIDPGLGLSPHLLSSGEEHSVNDGDLVTAVVLPAKEAEVSDSEKKGGEGPETDGKSDDDGDKQTSSSVVPSNSSDLKHPTVHHGLDHATELAPDDRARFARVARALTVRFDRDSNPVPRSTIDLAGREKVARHRRGALHDAISKENAGIDYEVAEDVVSFVYGAPERE